jgi:hypothetical protein
MCSLDWKGCDRKLSWQIWSTMWIRTDDRGWCHDLLWGAMWIGIDVNECCHDLFWSAMRIGKYETGSFHEQFGILCRLNQKIDDDVMT